MADPPADEAHDHGQEGRGDHDEHAPHDGHDPPADEAGPPPAHVFSIARVTHYLGLALWVGGAALAVVAWPIWSWTAFFVAGGISLYGMCVWLAARSTLADPAAP